MPNAGGWQRGAPGKRRRAICPLSRGWRGDAPRKDSRMARILITSALPYINGVKHLGNLAGSMLPADVYARFQRARGHEVLYICATDEHGTPAELAAAAARARTCSPIARSSTGCSMTSAALWPVVGLVRPLVLAAEPSPDPAFRRGAGGQRPDRGTHRPDGLFGRRPALPARPLYRGDLPGVRLRAGARRPVRQLRLGCSIRST